MGDRRVTIPYRHRLAELIPPSAVRLRRDFKAVLTLVRAHALVHQASRARDDRGRVVACHEDYAEVRAIVIGLVSEAVKATVSPAIRETVAAVADIDGEPNKAQVARHLGIDQSAGQRRVDKALAEGYLRNLEDKPNRAARLVVGDPLPDDVEILPDASELRGVCTYAQRSGGKAPKDPTSNGDSAYVREHGIEPWGAE